VRQPKGSKDLQRPAEVQIIQVNSCEGRKQSPGGLGTRLKAQWAVIREQKMQEDRPPMKQTSWERARVLKPQGLNKNPTGSSKASITWDIPTGWPSPVMG
jgi:hypothetical protein